MDIDDDAEAFNKNQNSDEMEDFYKFLEEEDQSYKIKHVISDLTTSLLKE